MVEARQGTFPSEVDVVVVGGGVVGLATAWAAAQKGLRVLLVEKGTLGAEQSSRAFGWISNLGLDPRKLDLTTRAKALWKDIHERTNGAPGLVRSGLVFHCANAQEEAPWRAWLGEVNGRPGVDARMLEGAELAPLLPGAAFPPGGALYGPSDGYVEPPAATRAVGVLARAAGAILVEGCAVRGVREEGGAVRAVVTEHGVVRARHVVVAAGAWSRLFCARHGIALPQLTIESSLARTTPIEGLPKVAFQRKGANFRPCADGSYVVAPDHGHVADVTPASIRWARLFFPALWSTKGLLRLRFGRRFFQELATPTRWRLDAVTPFERTRVLPAAPDVGLMTESFADLCEAFPGFRAAGLREMWAGHIDATPDSTPVISSVEGRPGFWIATGFSGYGLTHAPAAGEALAAAIAGETPAVDLSPYRLSRFFDGSPLILRE